MLRVEEIDNRERNAAHLARAKEEERVIAPLDDGMVGDEKHADVVQYHRRLA